MNTPAPKARPTYKTENISAMVALASFPYQGKTGESKINDHFTDAQDIKKESTKEFIDRVFIGKQGLFAKYKRKIEDHFSEKLRSDSDKSGQRYEPGWKETSDEFNKYMYEPRPYMLFGRFDLAFVLLIDDFELANREFMPYNPILDTEAQFDYQIIAGPSAYFEYEQSDKTSPRLVGQAKKTFLKDWNENGHFPLIGICELKLNNTLLIGAGGIISRFAEQIIHEIIEDEKQNLKGDEVGLEAILVESTGAHEFTLLLFSNSLKAISRAILRVKDMPISFLKKSFGNNGPILSNEEFEGLLSKTLLYKVAAETKPQGSSRSEIVLSICDNHIFVGASTTYGVDLYFHEPEPSKPKAHLMPFPPKEKVFFRTKWLVKPGHSNEAIKAIKDYLNRKGIATKKPHLILDNANMYIQYMNGKPLLIDKALDLINDSLKQEAIMEHLRQMHTVTRIKMDKGLIECLHTYNEESHEFTSKSISRNTIISINDIKVLHQNMQAIGVPKLVTQRLMWICSNFNCTMQDPMMFGFFIELRNFIMEKLVVGIPVCRAKLGERGYKSYDTIRRLQKLTDYFVEAHSNRYFNSHRFKELSDFRADWVGGIQQLVSAYDSAYKALCYPFGEKDKPISFAYVSGEPGVESSEQSIRLNYFHIFQPAIFLSIAGHEAVNFFMSDLVHAQLNFEGKFLFDDESYDHTKSPIFADYRHIDLKKLVVFLTAIDYELPPHVRSFYKDTTVKKIVCKNSKVTKTDLHGDVVGLKEKFQSVHNGVFCEHMRPEVWRYLIIDLISLYFNFNRDTKLFAFWHWQQAMQDYRFYENNEEPNINSFMIWFLRINIVCEWADKGFMDKNPTTPLRIIERLHDYYYPEGKKFILELLSLAPIKEWFEYFEKLAKRVVLVANDLSNEGIKEEVGSNGDIEYSIDEVNQDELFANIIKSNTGNSEEIKGWFLAGSVKPFSPSSQAIQKSMNDKKNQNAGITYANKTSYVNQLIYAYLSLMQEWSNNNENCILRRNLDNGRVLPINPHLDSKILFDTHGGIFTHDPLVRRNYFLVRSTLIKALWDMGFVEKLKLFDYS